MIIGPGTSLICKDWWIPDTGVSIPQCFGDNFSLTPGALYFCEEVIPPEGPTGFFLCPWDACGVIALGVKEKKCRHGNCIPYCPNLFRPLNDGDTSLVEDEKEPFRDDMVDAMAYALAGLFNRKRETIDE